MMTIVIFGGTGDLAKNKLFKALYHLENQGLIKEGTSIIGFSRKEIDDHAYREMVKDYIGAEVSDKFLNKISYFQGDLTDIKSYLSLEKFIKEIDDVRGVCSSKLFYLAVSPDLYEESFVNLAQSGLSEICSGMDKWTKILVEKPFGNDIKSARNLDKLLGKLFKEEQVYRIDHYLAKEAVQNFITFRFANSIFEPIWNSDHIDNVQIELLESSDVSSRGSFYDNRGALRDVGQNHILQMLALIAMESPQSLEPEKIRDARLEILKKVKLFSKNYEECVLRGQYNGYLDTDGVKDNSKTETFFRLKLGVDNKRWKNVPFVVSSGKALKKSVTRIIVNFRHLDSCIFSGDSNNLHRNKIIFEIQPENKIMIRFWAKRQSLDYELINEDLSFDYSILDDRRSDAYEKVLYDAIQGDVTLFNSSKEVSAQWNIIDPIISMWKDLPLLKYEKGLEVNEIDLNQHPRDDIAHGVFVDLE